jgi:uncharacterized protein YjbI with pentapeptide repeats
MADPTHLELLKQWAKAWNEWRAANPAASQGDFSGPDLSQLDLSGADLSGSYLAGANLRGANLAGAVLNKADLRAADLSGAVLTGAQLAEALLADAKLTGADLSGAFLYGADFRRVDLREVRLGKVGLRNGNLEEANLAGADLSGAVITNANLRGADLRGADLRGAKLRGSNLDGAELEGALLDGADLGGIDLDGLKLTPEVRRAQEERNARERAEAELERQRRELDALLGPPIHVGESASGRDLRVSKEVITPPPSTEVNFTVINPVGLKPQEWYTLLVYAHLKGALRDVQSDSHRRLGSELKHYQTSGGASNVTVARGAEIVVVPEVPGCRFNPPRASILWEEDWHGVEFRMQAAPDVPGFKAAQATRGRVAFYVGPILIAEVFLDVYVSTVAPTESERLHSISFMGREKTITASPYEAIFVSYSHNDEHIIEQLEKAYEALGFEYLRDVEVLRSGEEWDAALMEKIEEADIFQLCWSAASQRSPYVEREWRHALGLERGQFIRPVYWERPMPGPPPELSRIHFAYLEGYDARNV